MNDHFNQDFNLMKKAHHFSQMETLTNQRHHLTLKMETLTKQRYHLTMKMETLVKKRDHLSMKALTKQRNHLRKMVSFSFHTNPVDACEKDFHFTQKILHLQLYAFWTLVAQEPWDLGKQLVHFCRYVDSHPNSGLWYEIHPTSSRFFFVNSQQSKCTEKIVIFMYDHGWNSQFTEFDIVEEGDVTLLMSLPQMRNLGFQFELTPDKAYLSCARIGMRKMVLKTAISTHLILNLQDVAWYMSQVNFKTPQVKSFFSKHDHYEYSQIAVQQDQEEGEALVSSDYWQVDGLRRELIRHHRDKRNFYMKWKELRLQFQRNIF